MKRRQFLRNVLPVATLPLLNGLPVKAFFQHAMPEVLSFTNKNDNVLVLLQLSGGNDGLNTVIPLSAYSSYFNARSNIAIPEKKILSLHGNNTAGLHPSLGGLRDLYNDDQLAILQSVGYAAPDFSHFRASDIWESGSDSNQTLRTGWAGRYLDKRYTGFPAEYPNEKDTDPIAIQIGTGSSFALQGPLASMAVSIEDPASVYNLSGGFSDVLQNNRSGNELGYIRQVAQQTHAYTKVVSAAFNKVNKQAAYPENTLANQLKIVARLIKGGLKTPVYMVSIDGFDTHAHQVETSDTCKGKHADLLKMVGDSIKAFQNDLHFLNIQHKVMGVTFSEFGRRIKSNDSAGTDHGTAAPLFLFGSKVRSCIIGENPVIPAAVSDKDNISMQLDYRSVYNTLLQNWLCLPQNQAGEVLLKNYETLPVIQQHVCKQ